MFTHWVLAVLTGYVGVWLGFLLFWRFAALHVKRYNNKGRDSTKI